MSKSQRCVVLTLAWIQCITFAFAAEFTVFQKTYIRDSSAPDTITDTFSVNNPNTTWVLRATNGNLEDDSIEKVSSSTSTLNAREVLKASHFSQNARSIEVPVTVLSSNTIATQLRAKPGGRLKVEIVGQDGDPPVVMITQPTDGTTTSDTRPAILAEYQDALSGIDIASVQLTLDGLDVTAQASVTLTSLQFTPSEPLDGGPHFVEIEVADFAGNLAQDLTIFTVLTNGPPVLNPIGDQTVPLGSTLALDLTATDPDGDSVTLSVSPLPLPPNTSFNLASGSFQFQPTPDNIGDFSLTFSASDEQFTDSETVTFTVEGPAPGQLTSLMGRLLDTDDFVDLGVETPVVGATVSLLGTGASTNSASDGTFVITNVPAGSQILDIDTFTANPAPDGSSYAGFREEITLFEGVENVMSRPFFMPRIASGSLTTVDPSTTTIVVNADLGVMIVVPPFTAMNADGSFFTGELSISEVPQGLAPAALPDTLQPGLLITIQPVGVFFATPVPITFPNTDLLNPGSEGDIWSLDPETGTFIVVGIGQVSPDGSRLETISGGIRAADWHGILPPPPELEDPDDNFDNQDESKCCKAETGSLTAVSTGDLTEDHALASYRSLGQSRGLRLVYHSRHADPRPVITSRFFFPARFADFNLFDPPDLIASLNVAGVDQGPGIWTRPPFTPTGDQVGRLAVQFDASEFATGRYQYSFSVTSVFNLSRVGLRSSQRVLINNQQNSPFGAGWTLDGVQKLHIQSEPDGAAVITHGDGSTLVFEKATSGTGGFTDPTIFPGGCSPSSVAVGDFNGDTFLDLATPNQAGSNVSILLGDGTGGFAGPTNFPVGSTPLSITAGDFNGDTFLDLATPNLLSASVSILLGDGTGGFTGPTVFPTGEFPFALATGDFNGDTLLDLATGNVGSDNVSILLGDGIGGFTGPTNFPAGGAASSIVLGDFNGDTLLDLAAVNSASDNVSVLLGDGTGGLSGPTSFPVGQFPRAIAVGDFNRDALLDLAVANEVSNDVSVLLGDGTGDFNAATTFPTGGLTSRSIVAGDFNGDTLLDLVTTNRLSDNISILFGNSAGGFSGATNFPVGSTPFALSAGDFNGDALLDLAVALTVCSDSVSILLGIPNEQTGFLAPAGEFSRFAENDDGTFTRALKDGTRIEFDSRGLHTATVDRNENTTAYRYDPADRLIEIEDPTGLTTHLSYAGDTVSAITDPAGRITFFDHDGAGNLFRITDPDGSAREFSYNARHGMISQTSKNGFVTTYDYNFAGRNIQANRPDGSTRKVRPSQTLGLVDLSTGVGTQSNPAVPLPPGFTPSAIFTDGNDHRTVFETDRFGAANVRTDALGRRTTVVRDGDSNATQIIQPNFAVTTMTYDETGNLLTISDPAIGSTTTFVYDSTFNLVTSITDPNANTTWIDYDANGNPVTIIDALGNPTTFTYDERGLVLSVTDDHQSLFTRDPTTGNVLTVTDPLGNTTSFTYDGAGNVIASTDAKGHTTHFAYDAMNRLISTTDALGGITSHEYDNAGNLTSLTDANNQTTSFTYDSVNRITEITNPLLEITSFGYDANGNHIETLDAAALLITFTYDPVNQLTEKVLTNAFGAITDIVTFDYDSVGNLTRVEDTDSVLSFEYDSLGRLTSAQTGDPLNAALTQPATVVNYTYDMNGNRLTMTDSVGTTTSSYDALNRVAQIYNSYRGTFNFGYDALSRRTSVSYPNGIVADLTYDPSSQLLSFIHERGGTPIAQAAYTYDPVGNRDSLTDLTGTHTFIYDSLNSLTDTTHPPASGLPPEFFTYDAVGNRLSSHLSATYFHDPANSLLEDATFTYGYDANGNLMTRTDKATGDFTMYTHSVENHLTRIDLPDGSVTEYRYDGLGRRIEINVNGLITRYTYDNEDILLEFDAANFPVARFTQGPWIDEPLLIERGGENFFYHADELGSITALTDGTGIVRERYAYDTFGQPNITGPGPDGQMDTADDVALSESAFGNPYAFTARELEPDSGLYFYRARYYDPHIGRFIQEDPIGFAGGDINLYRYVFNSPMNFTDPTGTKGHLVPSMEAPGMLFDPETGQLIEPPNKSPKKKKKKKGKFFIRKGCIPQLSGIRG